MKKFSRSALVLSITLLALSLSAFAGSDRGSTEITLTSPATVGGAELAAGTYKVEWQMNGEGADVSFIQNKKVIATAPAKLTQNGGKARYSSLAVSEGKITELRLGGKNTVLVFA